jgi:hypothetical protein
MRIGATPIRKNARTAQSAKAADNATELRWRRARYGGQGWKNLTSGGPKFGLTAGETR